VYEAHRTMRTIGMTKPNTRGTKQKNHAANLPAQERQRRDNGISSISDTNRLRPRCQRSIASPKSTTTIKISERRMATPIAPADQARKTPGVSGVNPHSETPP